MSDGSIMMTGFFGAMLGDEAKGAETIAQVEPILLEGEEVEIATRGDNSGAVFTNLRLIIVNEAGLLNKRSVISFIRTASIDGVSIDADSMFQIKLAGRGFGGAHLFFNDSIDKIKMTNWLSRAVSQS